MSGDRADIVAVLPALDCAGTIADVVQGLRLHVGRVVVVSDGSRDDTAEVARRAGAEVEVLPENRERGTHFAGAWRSPSPERRGRSLSSTPTDSTIRRTSPPCSPGGGRGPSTSWSGAVWPLQS